MIYVSHSCSARKRPHRARRPLEVVQRALARRAAARARAVDRRVDRHRPAVLRPAVHMIVIPNLRDRRVAPVRAVPAAGAVVPRARAANVGNGAEPGLQRALHLAQGVGRRVARRDAGLLEPVPGGQGLVIRDGGVEEVDDVLVLAVLRAVAGHVEGGVAGGVLGELVRPEVDVGPALVDPVGVHPREQVEPAEIPDEVVYRRARVRRHAVQRAVGAGGGVGGGDGIVLAAGKMVSLGLWIELWRYLLQVAVLCERAVAVVRPQTYSLCQHGSPSYKLITIHRATSRCSAGEAGPAIRGRCRCPRTGWRAPGRRRSRHSTNRRLDGWLLPSRRGTEELFGACQFTKSCTEWTCYLAGRYD